MNKQQLLDRIEALERRNRAFERHSRTEIQALQQQLKAVLARGADAQAGGRLPQAEPVTPRPPARGAGSSEAERREPARRLHAQQRLPQRAAPGRISDARGPVRTPGVRIAYIGGRPEPIERIREYWEERGAIFLHYDCKAERLQVPLDQILARADLVFYPVDCTDPETAHRLEAFCGLIEKPLIPLHNAGMSGLRRALESWCPLT